MVTSQQDVRQMRFKRLRVQPARFFTAISLLNCHSLLPYPSFGKYHVCDTICYNVQRGSNVPDSINKKIPGSGLNCKTCRSKTTGSRIITCQKSKDIPTCDWFMKRPFCRMSVKSYWRGLMLLTVTETKNKLIYGKLSLE